jgi:hypothetical protein
VVKEHAFRRDVVSLLVLSSRAKSRDLRFAEET